MARLLNIIVVLCVVLGASAHRRNVDNFMGRSGQLIVELPEEDIHDDSTLLFKGKYFKHMDMAEVKDTQFMDLYGYVTGIPSANADASHEGYPSASLFKKPKASLIVNIAGAGAESLKQNSDLSITEGTTEIPLTATSYPLNTHVVLNNMATGTSASVHGIVGRTWTSPSGNKMTAHEKGGHSLASNIADILLQQYNGKSLVVSASASRSYASIFAAHYQTAVPGYNAHSYALTDRYNFFTTYPATYPVPQTLGLTHGGIQNVLTGAGFNTLFSTSYASSYISFNGISFSLKAKAESKLFGELAFVYNLIQQLSAGGNIEELVRDATPDLFTFTFSGLKGISRKYGADSDEYKAALHLVSNAAKALSEAIDAAYDSDTITIISFINPHQTIPADVSRSAYRLAKNDMSPQDFEKNFPAIYMNAYSTSKVQREQQCASMQRDLGLQVHCFSAMAPSYFVMDGNNTNNNTNGTNWGQEYRDSKYVVTFWILFFMTIVLFSFVGWGVYNLTFVGGDASRDSLLYRVSSRHHHQL